MSLGLFCNDQSVLLKGRLDLNSPDLTSSWPSARSALPTSSTSNSRPAGHTPLYLARVSREFDLLGLHHQFLWKDFGECCGWTSPNVRNPATTQSRHIQSPCSGESRRNGRRLSWDGTCRATPSHGQDSVLTGTADHCRGGWVFTWDRV